MAAQVHGHMRQKGLHLMLGSALQKIEDTETGVSLTVNGETIDADLLVMAIGVRPASEIAVKAGLPANAKGALIVNSAMETGVGRHLCRRRPD